MKFQSVNLIRFYLYCFMLFCPQSVFAEEKDGRLIEVEDLVSIRQILSFSVSPDGNHVAYQLSHPNTPQNKYDVSWYIAPFARSAEGIKIADGFEGVLRKNYGGVKTGELSTSEIAWSPDGNSIVYTASINGEVQLWRNEIGKAGNEKLTRNAGDVEKPIFSADGSNVFFAVGRTRDGIERINQLNSRTGYLAQEPAIYDVVSGPRLPPCRHNQNTRNPNVNDDLNCFLTVWVFEIETQLERQATEEEAAWYIAEMIADFDGRPEPGSITVHRRFVTWSSDTSNSAWFQNDDPSKYGGYAPPVRITVSLNGNEASCQFSKCLTTRPERLWWSEDGQEVIALSRGGDHNTITSLISWSPETNRIRSILSTDDRLFDCEKRAKKIVCGHESWTTPRKIVSIGIDRGLVETIIDPNPDYQEIAFTKVEKIISEDDFGNQTHAHFVYPHNYKRGKRYPLVIVQYRSRGFLKGGTGDEHPIHVLAANGIAVLSADTPDDDIYELYEGDDQKSQVYYLNHMIVKAGPTTALERMVDELVVRGVIDPSKVGITGLSQGVITLESAILRRDYAAASAGYTLSPSIVFELSTQSFWGKVVNEIMGGGPLSEEGFDNRKKYMLNWNADRTNTPFLIQVADREYHYTVQNYNALLDAGKPVEKWIFPDEYHVKWQPAHRLNVYRRNLQWFKFWLQNEEVDQPVDPDQYVRWRKLRDNHCTNMMADKERRLPVYCAAH